jgi:hypothetical protein
MSDGQFLRGQGETGSRPGQIYGRLTRRYLEAFESSRGELAAVVTQRVESGRRREDVIANVVAAVAPTWCREDARGAECAVFLSDWCSYVNAICSNADGQQRFRRYPLTTRRAIRDGLRLAIEAELRDVGDALGPDRPTSDSRLRQRRASR